MRFISTRGEAGVPLRDALLAGAPSDGGLYTPEAWPALAPERIAGLRTAGMAEVLGAVLRPFLIDVPDETVADAAAEACAGFTHAAVAPLVQLYPHVWLAERFHGPTLHPADLEFQVLSRVYEALAAREGRGITLWLAADAAEAAAAVAAVANRPGLRLAVLVPGTDSPRLPSAPNVRAFAVDGDLAACRTLTARRRSLEKRQADIGEGHILRQLVNAAAALSAAAPLGQGTVLAGDGAPEAAFVIKRLGASVSALADGPLAEALATGRLRHASSAVERLYFEAVEHEPREAARAMAALENLGFIDLPPKALSAFSETLRAAPSLAGHAGAALLAARHETGAMLDPATAAAVAAAKASAEGPVVVFSGAHPWLSRQAIETALGEPPQAPAATPDAEGWLPPPMIAPDDAALSAALSWR